MHRLNRRRERGSALMLMPAAVLVLVVLAAIAVDFALVRLGQRQLGALADAAGNDAATLAVPREAFDTGVVDIDPRRAREVVAAAVAARPTELDDVQVLGVRTLDLDGVPAVEVTLAGTVDHVFADAIPGAPDRRRVTATSLTRLELVPAAP